MRKALLLLLALALAVTTVMALAEGTPEADVPTTSPAVTEEVTEAPETSETPEIPADTETPEEPTEEPPEPGTTEPGATETTAPDPTESAAPSEEPTETTPEPSEDPTETTPEPSEDPTETTPEPSEGPTTTPTVDPNATPPVSDPGEAEEPGLDIAADATSTYTISLPSSIDLNNPASFTISVDDKNMTNVNSIKMSITSANTWTVKREGKEEDNFRWNFAELLDTDWEGDTLVKTFESGTWSYTLTPVLKDIPTEEGEYKDTLTVTVEVEAADAANSVTQ